MAILTVNYYSSALSRFTEFVMMLPNDFPPEMMAGNPHYQRPMKTLYLLHGYSGARMDWLSGSLISNLSGDFNLAVVCPSGENSFYLNGEESGSAYQTFVGEELPAYSRKTFSLSDRREDTLIGGLSMGGFGAIHTAFAYPETFGGAFGLSNALIVHDIAGMKKEDDARTVVMANYAYYRRVFGDLETVEERESNPEVQLKKLLSDGRPIPDLYLACGTEDALIEHNRAFAAFVRETGKDALRMKYEEAAGIHDWKFWNLKLETALRFLISGGEA